MIKKFRFEESVYHEDSRLIPIVLFNANKIKTVKYAPYFRLLRKKSITQRDWTEKRILDYYNSIKTRLEYVKEKNISLDTAFAKRIDKVFKNAMNNFYPPLKFSTSKISLYRKNLKKIHFYIFCQNQIEDIKYPQKKLQQMKNKNRFKFKNLSAKKKILKIIKTLINKFKFNLFK